MSPQLNMCLTQLEVHGMTDVPRHGMHGLYSGEALGRGEHARIHVTITHTHTHTFTQEFVLINFTFLLPQSKRTHTHSHNNLSQPTPLSTNLEEYNINTHT